jgi:hypothetical protein
MKIKDIEKVPLFIIAINMSVWIYSYWEKLDGSSIFISLFYILIVFLSLLIAYSIIYLIIQICFNRFAEQLLKKTVEYFHKEYQLERIEFLPKFYENISRQFSCYILIVVLLLDCFFLCKFKFSVLSVINTLIYRHGDDL